MIDQSLQPSANGTSAENVGTFVRLLAHELGNPVATIRMSAEMLAGGVPEELQKQLVEILLSESGRLHMLIDSAVYYTSIPVAEAHQIDIESLVGSVVRRTASDVPVDVRIEPDSAIVVADTAQVSRLFDEILANAIQAEATHIGVTVRRDGDSVLLSVRDDGTGIPHEKISAIFEPFYTTREGRLGLGLSIARRIAQLHGGSISVSDVDPNGTEVSIRLPAARQPR